MKIRQSHSAHRARCNSAGIENPQASSLKPRASRTWSVASSAAPLPPEVCTRSPNPEARIPKPEARSLDELGRVLTTRFSRGPATSARHQANMHSVTVPATASDRQRCGIPVVRVAAASAGAGPSGMEREELHLPPQPRKYVRWVSCADHQPERGCQTPPKERSQRSSQQLEIGAIGALMNLVH